MPKHQPKQRLSNGLRNGLNISLSNVLIDNLRNVLFPNNFLSLIWNLSGYSSLTLQMQNEAEEITGK